MKKTRDPLLRDVGEIRFLERLRQRRAAKGNVVVGIGDDCAVVRVGHRRLVVTTDSLVEDVHFRWEWQSAGDLGARAFAVNASDVAAMAGKPRFALLSIAAPEDARAGDLARLIDGFAKSADAAGCELVGGNLSKARSWMISATLIGEVSAVFLTRAGGHPGDRVYVTGTLGAAAFGREILLGRRKGPKRALRPFLHPQARLDAADLLASTKAASAAIDVSDGLLADLGHLCRASKTGATIEAERLPLTAEVRRLPAKERLRLAATGGEDYELLFTVPPRRTRRLEQEARRRNIAVTRIGELTRGRAIDLRGAPGGAASYRHGGHDHFRDR